jgi:hypothetical protein
MAPVAVVQRIDQGLRVFIVGGFAQGGDHNWHGNTGRWLEMMTANRQIEEL